MSATTNNNPSTEGKAPESTTTSTTTATASGTTPASTAASLPADYLTGGYFRGEGKKRYTDPALVGQAERIGTELAQSGVPASAVKKMFRTLKTAARLPYEAQQGALKKLTPLVLDLEHRKKAPTLLREVVERNQAAVENGADFAACLDHFRDIAIFLQAAQG